MLLTRGFLLLPVALTNALDLSSFTPDSIKNVSSTLAANLISNYTARDPLGAVGLFGNDKTIYWYEDGVIWGSLIDYWSYTGDDQYNDQVTQALEAQVGPGQDYMPPNQTKTEGNDDQALWALAALTAAERKLPEPSGGKASWEDLAVAVFNLQVERWDDQTCNGGIRWQIFTFNDGYDYKNSATQAHFFLLAARLARYTGNQTYADWATKSYEWTKSVGLIGDDGQVYDGTMVGDGCKVLNKVQWSYTNAAFLYGSAVMADLPNSNDSSTWFSRTNTFLSSISIFFKKGILTEIACEPQKTCSNDEYIFKGLAAQWLGETTQISLSGNGTNITDTISNYLATSAKAAAQTCSGTGEKETNQCGSSWVNSKFDGNPGLEQDLSVLNVVVANLAKNATASENSSTTATPSSTPSSTSSPTGAASSPKPSSAATGLRSDVLRTAGWVWTVAMAVAAGMWL